MEELHEDKRSFLTYFPQVFCFAPLFLLRDSWYALMIDKQNFVPLVSRCSPFLLPYANLFSKRSEFKQDVFFLCVLMLYATKVTRCCSTQLFFVTPLVFLIDPSKLKARNFSPGLVHLEEKTMYNWLLMTHIYVIRAKLRFFKVVLC